MDKKTKKRIEVLRKKLDKTRQLIVFAKEQTDEPDEVQKLEAQVVEIQSEINSLKEKA